MKDGPYEACWIVIVLATRGRIVMVMVIWGKPLTGTPSAIHHRSRLAKRDVFPSSMRKEDVDSHMNDVIVIKWHTATGIQVN
jgi:hypothetical protein